MENSASGHPSHNGIYAQMVTATVLEHLYAVLELAKRSGVKDVVVHCSSIAATYRPQRYDLPECSRGEISALTWQNGSWPLMFLCYG